MVRREGEAWPIGKGGRREVGLETGGGAKEMWAGLSSGPAPREEFNIGVLHAFVDLHEFTDLNLVQALR